MTTLATGSLNPFRDPQLIAQYTGSSSHPSSVSETSVATTTSSGTAPEQRSDSNDLLDAITEDAPPAYTPTADSFQGEEAMGFGPQRPFQYAPPPGPVPFLTPATAVRPTPTSAVVNAVHESTHSPARFGFPPPPRHPSHTSTSAVLIPPRTPAVRPGRSSPAPSHTRTQSQATAYLPPSEPLPHVAQICGPPEGPSPSHAGPQSFSPPPGLPPSHIRAQSFSPPPGPPSRGRPSAPVHMVSGSAVGTSTMPDDNRPTTTPMPGHPLLRKGKLLVYPQGHECPKCHNTGYKNNDPSHPCEKCWEKYARPYKGALAYAPFPSSTSSTPGGSGSNFQRPLPVFRTPQANFQSPHPHLTSGRHSPKLHRKHGGRRQSHSPPRHHRHSPPPHHHHHSPPPHHHPHHQHSPQYFHPPPGAFSAPPPPPHMHHAPPPPPPPPPPVAHHGPGPVIYAQPGPIVPQGQSVYPPGDPRIGGRLCWRCHGRGGVNYLLFAWETCTVCSGVGRVFT